MLFRFLHFSLVRKHQVGADSDGGYARRHCRDGQRNGGRPHSKFCENRERWDAGKSAENANESFGWSEPNKTFATRIIGKGPVPPAAQKFRLVWRLASVRAQTTNRERAAEAISRTLS